ncbi:hypothetical protein Cni_G08383 [Canna indica]|uniref:Transcription factor IIIC 90kDa subunit N-terminal domain-containing protein n=1 Tax=Canna indica TaxID=4628 RepID=A0AAQ3K439_9LILI|nr:hypothetical protein Cni_G08383 [Canna indica]
MASHWHAVPLIASPSYPNSIAWSSENLVAVASGHIITILNPASVVGPRGMITLQHSKPFPIGVVRKEDLMTPCLMPTCLSRDTRPCARSISWSQPGFASNSGCLLAVCTTDGHVKLYRPPLSEFQAEWVEAVDISDLLCDYIRRTNFREQDLPTTSCSQGETSTSVKLGKRHVTGFGDCSSNKNPRSKRNGVSRRIERAKYRKSLGEEPVHGSNGDGPYVQAQHNKIDSLAASTANNKSAAPSKELIIFPCSSNIQVSSNEVIDVGSKNVAMSVQISPAYDVMLPEDMQNCLPMITPEQYASRSALLSSIIVALSPVLQTCQIQPSLSNRCAILAVGGKAGNISLWILCEPEGYTIEHGSASVDPTLIGFLQAHNSWITAISWEMFSLDSSVSQLIMATGSSDGSVKIWSANVEDLVSSSEANNSPFSLLNEVTIAISSQISTISLAVPRKSQEKIVLAIGKGSGSIEVWICHVSCKKIQSAGFYDAHDQVVTGLVWAFDGSCLYSCSQDNSIKSWVLDGDFLHKSTFPLKFPGFENSTNLLNVSDQCFGLALSPGGLMLAAVRSFDSHLLHQMYQARTQKAVVEFFWTGGQSFENSVENTTESSTVLSERDLLCWESNILQSLRKFEDAEKPLVLWDILAALLDLKKSNPKFVDNLLLKWISSWFSSFLSGDSIDKILFHTQSMMPNISSRRIYLLNIVCRRLMLSKAKAGVLNGEQLTWDEPKNEGKFNVWNNLLVNNEVELQQRIVAFTFRAVLSHASCPSDMFSVGKKWFPLGVAQMECWILLNMGLVRNQLNVLRSEVRELGSRINSVCEYINKETCSFCSAPVPFESADVAWCEGNNLNSSSKESHKLLRCAVSMKLCSIQSPMWFCMCCHRWVANIMPYAFFDMPNSVLAPGNDRGPSVPNTLRPLCPFCGILLQRSMPEFLLSSSPV